MKSTFKLVLFFAAAAFILNSCNKKDPKDPCIIDMHLDIQTNSGSAILVADPFDGATPYRYLWSTGATSNQIIVDNVDTTVYSVTVTDDLGCTVSKTTNPIAAGVCDSTITDYDGNVYHVVRIGNQCWTVENLKTTHYMNGQAIPEAEDTGTWHSNYSQNTALPQWCDYNGNGANDAVYGKLYNWYALGGANTVAPAGWHVATESDYDALLTFLGGAGVAGGKMKTTQLWNAPNMGADNSSNYTAVPSGFRWETGFFSSLNFQALYWTSTEYNVSVARYYNLFYNSDSVRQDVCNKHLGLSARLVHD